MDLHRIINGPVVKRRRLADQDVKRHSGTEEKASYYPSISLTPLPDATDSSRTLSLKSSASFYSTQAICRPTSVVYNTPIEDYSTDNLSSGLIQSYPPPQRAFLPGVPSWQGSDQDTSTQYYQPIGEPSPQSLLNPIPESSRHDCNEHQQLEQVKKTDSPSKNTENEVVCFGMV